MVICKYYQQGTCKFGNGCRFEHVDYNPSGRYAGGHQYGQNTYYQGHNKQSGSYKVNNAASPDIEEIMKMIVQEVALCEKGGQWPLSCFAPIKEKQNFPGFEDYSPEEIRLKTYEALKNNNTLPETLKQIAQLYEAAKLRRNQILHPNSKTYEMVEKIIRGQKVESEPNFSFVQAASQKSGNQFGMWNAPAFGNTQQQQTSAATNFTFSLPQFGGSTNQSALQQQNTVFGGASSNQANIIQQQASIFGNSNNQITGQQPSVFGGSVNVQQQPNVFGGTPGLNPIQQQSNIFGGAANSSPVQQQSNVFGNAANSNPVQQATNIFGGAVAGTPAQSSGFFGSQMPSQSSFGGMMAQNAPGFIHTPPSIAPASNTTSVFGNSAGGSTWNKAGANIGSEDSSVYTPSSELTPEELSAFQAKTFTMGKVPTKPPPKELCLT